MHFTGSLFSSNIYGCFDIAFDSFMQQYLAYKFTCSVCSKMLTEAHGALSLHGCLSNLCAVLFQCLWVIAGACCVWITFYLSPLYRHHHHHHQHCLCFSSRSLYNTHADHYSWSLCPVTQLFSLTCSDCLHLWITIISFLVNIRVSTMILYSLSYCCAHRYLEADNYCYLYRARRVSSSRQCSVLFARIQLHLQLIFV